jgi:hypothetical protein
MLVFAVPWLLVGCERGTHGNQQFGVLYIMHMQALHMNR